MKIGSDPRRRRFRWALGVVLALGAATANAQPSAVPALSVLGRSLATLSPDGARTVTVTAVLANSTSTPLGVAVTMVGLPTRWRVVSGTDHLIVPARGRATWVSSVAVPSGTNAGTYTLRARFAPEAAPGGAAAEPAFEDSATVTVVEHSAITMRVIEPLGALVAGETARALLRIENRGNARGSIWVDATASLLPSDAMASSLDAQLQKSELRLEPGASETIALMVRAPKTVLRVTPISLDIRASMGDARSRHHTDDDDGSARETLRTFVVPDGISADARLQWLPARATVRAGTAGAGLPLEIVGSGILGSGAGSRFGGTIVDVALRGPQLPMRTSGAFASIGERSEYRVAIRSKNNSLTLGDQAISLTPLTEPGRVAFGMAGRADRGRLGMNALVARDGVETNHTDAAGLGVHVDVPHGVELGLYGLQRAGAEASSAATSRVTADIDSMTHVTLEAGLGRRLPGNTMAASDGTSVAHAALAEVTMDRTRFGATLRHADRGAGYPGDLQGIRDDMIATRLRFGPRFRLEARGTQNKLAGGALNLTTLRSIAAARAAAFGGPIVGTASVASLDSAAGISTSAIVNDSVSVFLPSLPSETRTEGEMGAYLGDAIGVAFAVSARAGTSGGLAYDGVERRIRVQGSHRMGMVQITGQSELGMVTNRLTGSTGMMTRGAATVGMQFSPRAWASGYADVRHGPTLWSGPATTLSIGMDSRLILGGGFSARVSGSLSDQRSLLDGLVPVANRTLMAQLDTRLERALPNERTVSLRIREAMYKGTYGASLAPGARGVAVEYSMPLRLPAWRAARSTQVTGRIVEQETGKGIPRALVQLDDNPQAIVMSDAEGRVRFPDAAPGTHRLTLLSARATMGRVAANPASLLVAATTRIGHMGAVSLVRGGRLRGAVCRTTDAAAARDLSRRASAAADQGGRGPAAADPGPDVPALDSVSARPASMIDADLGDVGDIDAAAAAVDCGEEVGISDALVTLASALDTIQVATDARGGFTATGLRPGTWEVRVASAQLPDGLAFPTGTQTVELGAGRDVTTRLRAIPRPRTFRQLRVNSATTTSGSDGS